MMTVTLVGAAAIALIQGDSAAVRVPADASAPVATQQSVQPDGPAQWALGHGYERRGDHIYFKGERIDEAGRSDLKRFEAALGRPLVLAHDVDAPSFAALSEEYAKDKNTVYYTWISPGRFWVVEIPGADPATFEVMDFNLAKDAHRVWRADVPIRSADAATAIVVHPGWVWKDKNSVYYQFTPLVDADPESFRHLDQAFYRDANHVYWSTDRLAGADPNTFRTFGNDVPYAADERHVWFGAKRIPHVDAGSFRLLHNHVFADKDGVYVSGEALPVRDADAASFRKVAELDAAGCVLFRDATREYLFDPMYIEIYTMTRARDAVLIAKPVWFARPAGSVRHAATVSATWRDDALSEPTLDIQPGFEQLPQPTWEVGKLERMTDAIREALTLLGRESAAAPGDARRPRSELALRRGER